MLDMSRDWSKVTTTSLLVNLSLEPGHYVSQDRVGSWSGLRRSVLGIGHLGSEARLS